MSKFLIILFVIVISIFLGLNSLRKIFLKKIDDAFGKAINSQENKRASMPENKILYEKEDVVVLKGESKSKKDK